MIIKVKIKPNSKKGPLIEPQDDGSLLIFVRAVAADGQANKAVVELLSSHYNISKSKISIKKGASLKHKLIEIIGI